MQREAPAPLIRQVLPEAGFSPALEAVVLKAMSKMAEDRFQSAAEMAAAIEATPEGQAGGARGRGGAASGAAVRGQDHRRHGFGGPQALGGGGPFRAAGGRPHGGGQTAPAHRGRRTLRASGGSRRWRVGCC